MDKPDVKDLGRVRALDGVRGLAILLVMICHMTIFEPTGPLTHLFQTISTGGWIGVDLFFVLSGALITGILLDTKEHAGYFKDFYARRVLRIFPLYYAILMFSFHVLPLVPSAGHFLEKVDSTEPWYWLFLSNFVISRHSNWNNFLDVSWSLAIEEQFYLIWPTIVLFSSRRGLGMLCGALALSSLALRVVLAHFGVSHIAIYVLAPTHLDGLCVGALVAIAVRSGFQDLMLRRIGGWLLAGGALCAVSLAVARGTPDGMADFWVENFGITIAAAAFGGLVLVVYAERRTSGPISRVLSNRFLTQFGLFSYAMYLTHVLILAILRNTVLRPSSLSHYPGGVMVGQFVCYVVGMSLTFGVGYLSYHLFEKHFLSLKRYFTSESRPEAHLALARPTHRTSGAASVEMR